jgi:PKD domain
MASQGRRTLWAFGAALVVTLAAAQSAQAAPTWLPAQSLGTPQTQEPPPCGFFGCVPGIGGVDVATDANGNVTLLWARRTMDTDMVLQTTSRPAGGSFSAPQDIGPVSAPFLGILNNSSIALDGQGNAIAVWPDSAGIVKAAFRPAGGAFGGPVELSTGTSNSDPRLAMSSNGTAVVTWFDGTSVRAASRPPGGSFGPGQDLGTAGGTTPFAQVSVNDSGAAAVVWVANPGGGNGDVIRSRVRTAGGDFAAAPLQTLSAAAASQPASFPDVEIDSTGRATAIWARSNGTHTIIQSKATPLPTGTFGDVDELSETGASASFPQVALDAENNAIAIWVRNGLVESAARASGATFAAPVAVSGPGSGTFIPRLAMDAAGSAVAVWTQSVGADTVVQASRRPKGGSFGSVDTISPFAGDASFPRVVFDNEGNIVAAWSYVGADAQYVAQVAAYDAAAPTLAAVSVPSAGTAGQEVGMAAAATDRWSPVSLSWNFGDGGTAAGGAVTHAFGSAGAFNVTVTATDGVGNAASATRPIAITPAAPPPKKRITSKVRATWGVSGKRIFLLRLSVNRVPKGGKVELRCSKSKKCPFKRKSSKKRRKGTITLFKEVQASKVTRMKQRRFRAGQRLELRITAAGYIGKVVRYKLKKGKIPSGQTLCLPVGKKNPRARC